MQGNGIKDFEVDLSNLKSLRRLNLACNGIQQLRMGSLPESLRFLNVGYNKLNNIPGKSTFQLF